MTLQDIDVGTIANDGTGDNPREGAIKINSNNALVAAALSGAVAGGTLAGTEKLLGLDGSTNKAWLVSQLATFIAAQIIDSAPATLDTLNELAAALGDDANFATTMTTALAGKQPLDSDLTAIAALATTTFGRALLTMADATATRTAIGAQENNANLSAIAAATPIADSSYSVGGMTIDTVGGIITAIY